MDAKNTVPVTIWGVPVYVKQYGHYDSRQLAVAGRSLNIVEPNPIHG